ncbi:hypothetical protein [Klenkia brasiliensis]|uniref:Uncharacterized protein n=1 Tax=Klenkia brasiliensis TaxID=333142 RepID=A0A1G7MT65_9ACTN|nr:hypothetical protein [Klenkia brasiliensis]SDF65018.1 hypothetical protein SAMN05660324_0776 [Klenkia brasiliensis]
MPPPILTFVGHDLLPMDEGLYSWVDIKRFAIEENGSDHDLVATLLADRQYRDTYAESYRVEPAEQEEPFVHGPYWLHAIQPASFQSTDPASARATIQKWADDPEPPSSETHVILEKRVFPLLSVTPLYYLPDLRPDGQHDWGGVVGATGFHEFVAIDRPARSLVLVVASDD